MNQYEFSILMANIWLIASMLVDGFIGSFGSILIGFFWLIVATKSRDN